MVLLKRILKGVLGVESVGAAHKERVLEYGYVILNFEFPELRKIQSRIFPATLHQDDSEGVSPLEENPHMMFQYGIGDSVSPRRVEQSFGDIGATECRAFNMSILHMGGYDVLKFDVRGEMIEAMSSGLWKLKGSSILPKFNDCLRVAKLKSDAGKMIVGLYNQEEYVLTPKYAVYCDVYGDKHLVWSC